jgi:hypothetical protein
MVCSGTEGTERWCAAGQKVRRDGVQQNRRYRETEKKYKMAISSNISRRSQQLGLYIGSLFYLTIIHTLSDVSFGRTNEALPADAHTSAGQRRELSENTGEGAGGL